MRTVYPASSTGPKSTFRMPGVYRMLRNDLRTTFQAGRNVHLSIWPVLYRNLSCCTRVCSASDALLTAAPATNNSLQIKPRNSQQSVDYTTMVACCLELRRDWVPSRVEEVCKCMLLSVLMLTAVRG